MLLTKEIEITIKQSNINYYSSLGYDIKYNDIILVKTEQLPNFSRKIVDVKCDICGKEKKIKYFVYYKNYIKYNLYACSQKCCQIKINKTNKERYGYNRPIQNKDIRKKLEDTCVEKYGFAISSMNKNIKEKSKQSCLDKFGFNCSSKNENIKDKQRKTINDKVLKKYKHLNINYISDSNYNFKCENGHNFDINIGLLLNRIKHKTILCTICNPIGTRYSGLEYELIDFIRNNYDKEIVENNRNIISPNELDIYLPELKLAFEFNGLYWHSELYKENNYHLKKTEMCEKIGIKLIHIYEDDWLYKKEIVKSRILNLLGKSEKIMARKCEIKEIENNKLIKIFLDKNHIQGFIGSQIKLGLFLNEELISFMNFGVKRKSMGQKSEDDSYELLRFCNKINTNVIGGASRLFRYFINNYNPKEVISYADRSWSNGNLYEKLEFELVHKTKPNYYYIVDGMRKYRFNYRKDKLIKEGSDPNKTEHEIMIYKNIYRIYDSGHLKYKITYV